METSDDNEQHEVQHSVFLYAQKKYIYQIVYFQK